VIFEANQMFLPIMLYPGILGGSTEESYIWLNIIFLYSQFEYANVYSYGTTVKHSVG